MKIVKIKGGLGNQMFQYAFAKLLEKRTGEIIKLDFSQFILLGNDEIRQPRIKKFHMNLENASQEEIKLICKLKHNGKPFTLYYNIMIFIESKINKSYFFESNRAYINPNKLLEKNYFDGYWQSYKYVDEVIEELKTEFKPESKLSDKSLKIKEKMENENSVFIGVRKGDYSKNSKHYGNLNSEYYEKAIKTIEKKVENITFYIFSNDISWCKKNLDLKKKNVIYRNPEEQVSDFEELILMSSCKHAIIANSTYHWWGATMIENKGKIICCPKKWFFDDKPIDIIPKQWIKI